MKTLLLFIAWLATTATWFYEYEIFFLGTPIGYEDRMGFHYGTGPKNSDLEDR